MFRPICKVTIWNKADNKLIELVSVNNIEIESSWKNLTDTAKITLPRKIRTLTGNINEVIKRGSHVEIELGYEPDKIIEFTGYVARVDAQIPLTIYCEDEMWKLKQNSFTHAFRKIQLKELISFIYPGRINVIDFILPSYRVTKASAAQVLNSLKEQYGIISYFRDGVLNVGFAYELGIGRNRVIYNLQRNVPADGINLEYYLPEDYKVKLIGTALQPDNKLLTYSVGDKDGDERKINAPFGTSDEALKKMVDESFKRFQVASYKGSLKTFGKPFCKHGDIADIRDEDYPERNGSYFIDKVVVGFGTGGFRRMVELGRKAS